MFGFGWLAALLSALLNVVIFKNGNQTWG